MQANNDSPNQEIDLLNTSVQREQFSQRLSILMFLSILGIITSFFYAAIFKFYLDYDAASIFVVICGSVYLTSYIFAKNKMFNIARHIIATIFIFQISLFSIYLFPDHTGFQYYYLVAMPLIYLLFTHQHNLGRMIYSVIALALLVLIEVFGISITAPINLGEDKIAFLHSANIVSASLVLSITIYLFANMMEKTEQESREQAITDSLTGLYNRRHFFTLGEHLLSLFKRNDSVFSLLFLDIDHFKNINDSYGHETGDKFLKTFANVLTENVRSTDIVARIGGEEFIIIFTNTRLKHATAKAEVIRLAVVNTPMPIEGTTVTTSIGVSEVNKNDASINKVLMRADHALYQAKNSGRNNVQIYSEKQP